MAKYVVQEDDQESVIMSNKNGQKFLCFLPKVEKAKTEMPVTQHNTSSMIVETEKRVKLKTPDELLEAFKERCFLRVSIYISSNKCLGCVLCLNSTYFLKLLNHYLILVSHVSYL